MARVTSAPPQSLPDDLADLAGDQFYGILAQRPEILRAWFELDKVFFGPSSTVDNRIKEEQRRTLSQGVGCRLCASLGTPGDSHPDPREAVAVAFAGLLASDHRQIDESSFAMLREEFDEREIVELVSWLCFKYGSNMFGALMDLVPASETEIASYADFVAHG
jgi:alkylhydroperoxidase family enzyme